MVKGDQVELLAQRPPSCTVMYFVRTVCELIRLKSETKDPARMQDDTLRALAVFFEGLEMMVMGAESKVA